MKSLLKYIFTIILMANISYAQNSDLSSADEQALVQTIQMLQDSEKMKQETQTNKDAKKADLAVDALVRTEEQKKQLYKIAAQIFSSMVHKSKGNVGDMNTSLESAMKNPEDFANQLTPEQKKLIKDLAKQIGEQNIQPNQ